MAESRQERETVVLEEGDIFFLYRPRVEEERPSKIGDVQRFEMVLRARLLARRNRGHFMLNIWN
ncbi:hypothetical protein QN219_28880 [Sinorhizobium sp. 7-81]|uniref:hypothetical protein n=1 Tax=Sinorhizobium sp. 8-89 TaxID=3049089 RepID=UPI0024C28964|nr:hypothetical protein [Sinorhizobium sp. 8-89]MDK1494001.1 hypothetical protein [Sinorhizobium sp. 8-89]